MYSLVFKRLLDLLFSSFTLVVLSPVFVILILSLWIVNKGDGVFFFQERPGRNSRIFRIIKFKTMTDTRDLNGILLPDSMRLTRFGQFLRKTSADELPQLINIFKGDMSLIGPRPLLVRYLPLYSKEQLRRHDVRPGITGWAQVNGRNSNSWQRKFELDVWYVSNLSFLLDLKIFFRSIKKVVQREDVNMEGEATTLPFNGSN